MHQTPPTRPARHRRPRGAALAAAVLLLATGIGGAGCSSDDGTNDGAATTRSGASATTRPDNAGPDDRPNFVFVNLDDLDALTMPYWEAMPRTKALLADTGLTFTNSFVSSPECCPSRATALTGNYPHDTGVYDATAPDGGYEAFRRGGAQRDTLATRLHHAGYRTAFIGKYLNGYEQTGDEVPPGWDEWFGVRQGFIAGYHFRVNHNGRVERYGGAPEDYLTDVLARETQATLAENEHHDGQPFLLNVWPTAPHDAIPAAPRHRDNPFADATPPRRPNYGEADVSDKPSWLRDGMRPIAPVDEADLTARYRNMMGSLYAVDDLIEDLVRTLEADGELDRTLIIFTSDNGYNFGAHRLMHKMAPYEESIRVPLVITGLGTRRGVEDRMVLNNDLTPTLLDLAGAPRGDLDGRSLVPLLHGDEVTWRDDFPIEYHGTFEGVFRSNTREEVEGQIAANATVASTHLLRYFVPTFRALRTRRNLYVQWYAGDDHEYELYDLEADPYEMDNLLATPEGRRANASLVDRLQVRLEELTNCSGPSCRS